jgi:hypothetical protein
MTKKAELYKKYIELRNEYYTLKGETDKVVELTDEYLNGRVFDHHVRTSKTSVLESDITSVKNAIASAKKELKRDEYFKTPEGEKYKSDLLAKRTSLTDKIKEIETSARNYISSIIEDYLGKGWEVGRMGWRMRICYVKGYDEDGKPLVKRSYNFTIDYECRNGEDKFCMNYPTCGSWDLLNDEDMRTYLAGVGKFGTDKHILEAIMNGIKVWAKQDNEYRTMLYRIDDKLTNPEALKD